MTHEESRDFRWCKLTILVPYCTQFAAMMCGRQCIDIDHMTVGSQEVQAQGIDEVKKTMEVVIAEKSIRVLILMKYIQYKGTVKWSGIE